MATATASKSDVFDPQATAEPEGLYEVVDGQVRQRPEMWVYEAFLSTNLMVDLNTYGRLYRLGRAYAHMLYLLNPETNLQRRPNVTFISADRWPLERRPARGKWALDIVPDLAVEIISPTHHTGDDFLKVQQYFQAGVKLVWMVLTSVDQVYAYHSPTEIQVLGRGDALEGGLVVPGFRVELNDLFGESVPSSELGPEAPLSE